MSLKNWAICPRCRAKAAAESVDLDRRAAESYGKVPAAEYLAMRARAEQPPPVGETMRERVVAGFTSAGFFQVTYTGHCVICDFTHSYAHCVPVDVGAQP